MRALLVVSKAQATVRALSIRKAGATTLTLLAVSLCGPEPGTVWRARRAVAFYDRRQDTRAGAELDPGPFRCLVSLLHPAKLPLGRLLYGRYAGPRGDDRSYFLGIEVDRAFSPLRRREQQIRRSADSRIPDNLSYHLVDGRASVLAVFVCKPGYASAEPQGRLAVRGRWCRSVPAPWRPPRFRWFFGF